MSRVRILNASNKSVVEFNAPVNRGWTLNGSASVQGGTETTVMIPNDVAENPDLQFGRIVLIEHDSLPSWAGVIDTPWKATSPVEMTLYGVEYLLALRSPTEKMTYNGIFESVLDAIILEANKLEDLRIRKGSMGEMPIGQQQLTLEQVPLWEQLNDFGKREGVEFYMRPDYQQGDGLTLYIDAGANLGIDTQQLLHDGENANAIFSEASVEGEIWNHIIGIGNQDTDESRLQSSPFLDVDSIYEFRLRNKVMQFGNLTLLSSVEEAARNELEISKRPKLWLTASIKEEMFAHCQVGNRFLVHASQVYLPGGQKGWRGKMRLMDFAYDEVNDTVYTIMECDL